MVTLRLLRWNKTEITPNTLNRILKMILFVFSVMLPCFITAITLTGQSAIQVHDLFTACKLLLLIRVFLDNAYLQCAEAVAPKIVKHRQTDLTLIALSIPELLVATPVQSLQCLFCPQCVPTLFPQRIAAICFVKIWLVTSPLQSVNSKSLPDCPLAPTC